MSGSEEVIQLLCARGACVTAKAINGITPLHCAVYCGNAAVVRQIMSRGADVMAQAHGKATPLHFSAYSRNTAAAICGMVRLLW